MAREHPLIRERAVTGGDFTDDEDDEDSDEEDPKVNDKNGKKPTPNKVESAAAFDDDSSDDDDSDDSDESDLANGDDLDDGLPAAGAPGKVLYATDNAIS